MNIQRRVLLVIAAAVATLSFCADAGAATVTVGPDIDGSWNGHLCETSTCTFANSDLGGTGANLVSPVTGTIVRWGVIAGGGRGTFRLRTVIEQSPIAFSFSRSTEPEEPVWMAPIQGYQASLPIAAGQAIALSMTKSASVGIRSGVGQFAAWASEPAETGGSVADSSQSGLLGLYAEVEPEPPAIASLGVTTGSTAGGTVVTITGSSLASTSVVTFGAAPATSFKVESDDQLSAVAPASATAGPVPVTVATLGGQATAPQSFSYFAPPGTELSPPTTLLCRVPRLNDQTLKASKKALRRAHCAAGLAPKRRGAGAGAGTGKVAKQIPKPGTSLPAGSKVVLTLKP